MRSLYFSSDLGNFQPVFFLVFSLVLSGAPIQHVLSGIPHFNEALLESLHFIPLYSSRGILSTDLALSLRILSSASCTMLLTSLVNFSLYLLYFSTPEFPVMSQSP